SKIYTVAFEGVKANTVTVETQFSPGLPSFAIVGLANKAVSESRERIRACFQTLGFALPCQRITVNLAPADLQKDGSHYDLPIALGIMAALNIIDRFELEKYIVLGEIRLDGTIAAITGTLPAAIQASANNLGIIIPKDCAKEATWAGDLPILAAENIMQIVNHFKGRQLLSQPEPTPLSGSKNHYGDFQEIKGQTQAKRAAEIAAAGGHNLLLVGPPGAGKSMLASRIPSILPDLTPQEALEVTILHSLCGLVPENGLVTTRPYRAPHHSASLPAMVGGGSKAKPGEISLSHHGVLFLDELPEFHRQTLESLRQPLETHEIAVSRVNNHITYPANIQLIAAMNPCRCGYYGQEEKHCHRVPSCAREYQSKISGPLIDRFDMILYIQPVSMEDLRNPQSLSQGEESALIAQRVADARNIQAQRTADTDQKHIILNARLSGKMLEQHLHLTDSAKLLLDKALEKLGLSARGYHRVMRVARTIADLGQSHQTDHVHIAEALSYRHTMIGN
ncbi:MAG: YifB family Mg chelatase-like AAA ATPase, partial [Alphaproteobacteria bacterium]|nr:YifB family Mg chelatase-like AAA ATPase [Alphaproteobacteria bacterium]